MKKTLSKKMAAPATISSSPPRVLVLRSAGTNCDAESVHALQKSGAICDRVHVNQLLLGRVRLHPYQILLIPGGFSYGDDISAGKVLATELKLRLKDQLDRFIEAKKLIIGVCNGFQVLVKTGLLPGFNGTDELQCVTLALNDSARFQCKWVELKTGPSAAGWLNDMPARLSLPIAHGEGKFVAANPKIIQTLRKNGQIVFEYADNPNGSEQNIAGICNPAGTVIGLMPHPERFTNRFQHPNWPSRPSTERDEGDGLLFWKKAVQYGQSVAR